MIEKTDKLREVLQTHGLRYSRPRAIILELFGERDMHVSAEHLYLELKQRGENLSLSTVYLNLGVLKNAGLVREFSGLAGEALYDTNVGPHHHLICTTCGAIVDLPELSIEGERLPSYVQRYAEAASGWRVREPSLALQGLCPGCRMKKPDA